MKKTYNTLSSLLALQLSFAPLQATFAQAAVPTEATSKSPRVIVVEIQNPRLKAQWTEQVTDSLRDNLAKLTDLQVVSAQQTYDYLASNPDLLQKSTVDPYTRYIDEAKQFYRDFDFKSAATLLDKTLNSYRVAPSAQLQPFPLVESYQLLGHYQLTAKNERAASLAFQEAIRFDPQNLISEVNFPPSTVELYKKERKDYLNKMKSLSLDIQSNVPKAQVYLNGVLKGEAPLRLESITEGEQFITLVAPGYRPEVRRFESNDKNRLAKFDLQSATQTKLSGRGLSFSNLQDNSGQTQVATNLAQSMNADKVILVSLEERGWNYKINARMIDKKYQASHKPLSVEVLDIEADTPQATSILAKDLQHVAKLDLGKDPERYAEGDVVVLGRKKKKSLLKSPLLWSLVGVAVAGGATAGLLAGRSGESGDPSANTAAPGTFVNVGGGIKGAGN